MAKDVTGAHDSGEDIFDSRDTHTLTTNQLLFSEKSPFTAPNDACSLDIYYTFDHLCLFIRFIAFI